MELINQIKETLDSFYGFNIMSKTRKREYAYSRKIFLNLCSRMGFSNRQIFEYCGVRHDIIIYSKKTLHHVKYTDVLAYNNCVKKLCLPLPLIPNVKYLEYDVEFVKALEKLKPLGRKDLKYFNEKVLKPFLTNLKKEKEIQNITNKIS